MNIIIKIVTLLTLGIFIFYACGKEAKPLETPAENIDYLEYTVDDAQAKNIATKLKTRFLKDEFKLMEATDKQFQFYKIDLNGDEKSEYIVRLMGSYFCRSGGCTFLLLGNDLDLINKFTVTRPPFFVSKIKKNGWRIMMVKSEGKFQELIYKNGKYPSNPSVVEPSEIFPSGHDEILFEEKEGGIPTKTYVME